MDFKELIGRFNKNTAAYKEQTKKMERQRQELGVAPLIIQQREPTYLELLLEKWEWPSRGPEGVELPSREPEGVGLPSREPEGVELPSREPEGVELPLPEPEGVELPSREPERVELPLPEPEGVELPSREPERVELPLPEPEGVELPSREPERVELPLPEPEGVELPSREPERVELPLPEPRGEEPPLPEPSSMQASPALPREVPSPVIVDTWPECPDLPELDLAPRSQHCQAQSLAWSLTPLPLESQTSLRKRQTSLRKGQRSLAFPLLIASLPLHRATLHLEFQRSLRRSTGARLCLSVLAPGHRSALWSPWTSRLGPSSPVLGPSLETPEGPTHPQARPWKRAKIDICGLEDFLKRPLEQYVRKLEVPVRVVRMEQRSGLIRARLKGASLSTGQVITFLDAHCECTMGWLEPLLARIKLDRRTVVCPIIDVISDDTFEYMAGSDMTYGGFNWKLNFRWYPVPQREMDRRKGDRTLPVRRTVVCPIIDVISDDTFEYMAGSDMTYGGFNWKLNFRWYPVPQREMDRRKGDRTLPVRRTVVCPIIDVISDDTFEYMAGSDMTYGGFNWKLNFRWYPVPQREMDRRKGDRTLPVRRTVVCPIIDVISDDTFEYMAGSDMTYGGFNWKLNFRWYPVPQREMDRRKGDRTLPACCMKHITIDVKFVLAKLIDPLFHFNSKTTTNIAMGKTPTMAGGLFSIDRDYFQEIGTYDAGMDIWGGENLEISFRIWQCGGTLEIVTCSHVGHVFRKATPYTFPGGTGQIINKNNRRLAEVWMDEFKNFFYIISPGHHESLLLCYLFDNVGNNPYTISALERPF
ncbi:UNVERIFIED_CONTAM: hypothetical protein FKN15_047020 [Acipenser sinensis]